MSKVPKTPPPFVPPAALPQAPAGASVTPSAPASSVPASNVAAATGLIADGAPSNPAQAPKPATPTNVFTLTRGTADSSVATTYPFGRSLDVGQEVRVPLPAGELHLIELEYQDVRALGDLEFGYRLPGAGGEYRTFRGSDFRLPNWPSGKPLPQGAKLEGTTLVGNWFTAQDLEAQGVIQIHREPDHNSPWIYNPIRVQVDVLFPDGKVHEIGKKLVDFSVHDAHSLSGSGYPEIDNISNGYENLPKGQLPAGCMLRLRPVRENRAEWEKGSEPPMTLAWVRPEALPPFTERKTVFEAGNFQPPPEAGYKVDAGRPIKAVLVTWTDEGTPESGYVHFPNAKGADVQTPPSNIGSGETELIPLDGAVPKNGVIFVSGGSHLGVRKIHVLYGD